MKKKIFGIFVFTMLIMTVTSAVAMNLTDYNKISPIVGSNNDVDWWPMFAHDPQHTGFSTSIAPNTNKLNWSYGTGSEISTSSSVVFENKLYIGTGEIGSKGALNFEFIKNNPIINIINFNEEMLQTETGGVFCIDTITGKKIWDFTTQGAVSSTPIVYNGCVYIFSSDSDTYSGELYCLDADTGVKHWNFTYTHFITTPLIEDDNLFILIVDSDTNYGRLLCLNPINGVEKWNHSIGFNNFAMYSAPAVYNGKVYFTSLNSSDVELHSVDVATGQEVWTIFLTKMELGLAPSTPVINEGKVFVISLEAYITNQTLWSVLFCIDAENGDEIWKYVMQELELSLSTPAVHNDMVYFSYAENYFEYGGIACFNALNGEVIWNQKLYYDFFAFSSPAIADGKLYIGSMNIDKYASVLNCYNLFSGDLIWSYSLGEFNMVGSSPAIADGKVYIADIEGTIYTFKDNTPPDAPTIDGPLSGNPETLYEYSFTSIDTDGDDIAEFIIDWGDSTEQDTIIGPFASGEEAFANHTWDEKGTYTIKAKAKDTFGNESNWSEFEVLIPRNKVSNYNLIKWLFERFPNLFLILRQLLGL